MKMKTKAITLLLALIMTLAAAFTLTGCDKPIQRTDETLYIAIWEGGFGSQYMKNVVNAFKAKNPWAKVTLKPIELRLEIYSQMVADKKLQQNDLYFIDDGSSFANALNKTLFRDERGDYYQEPFLDLSDVYDYKWEGEDYKISEKIIPQLLDYATFENGKRYLLNYGMSAFGMTYIPELVNPFLINGELPRTTDELSALYGRMKSGGAAYYPLILSGKADYWTMLFQVWWAQYEGLAGFNRYFAGQVIDPETSTAIYSPDIFSQVGRLRSMEEIERFIGYTKGFIDPSSVGYEFIAAQMKYLNGQASMMVNGGWLENEMKNAFNNNIPYQTSFMRLPVLSSIMQKCPSLGNDDAKLSALIKAIDEGSEALSGTGYSVTQPEFDRVKEARKLMYVGGEMDYAIIPATSYNPNLAKEFLKFLYSDAGIKEYTKALSGSILPVWTYDYNNDSAVQAYGTKLYKSGLDLFSTSTPVFVPRNTRIQLMSGVPVLMGQGITTLEQAFCAMNVNDRKSPNDVFTNQINYYAANNGAAWKAILQGAGLQ